MMKCPIFCCFLAAVLIAGGERKKLKKKKEKEEEAGLRIDSWWVFYYVCGQVGLRPPCGPRSSPQCPAFDFEL